MRQQQPADRGEMIRTGASNTGTCSAPWQSAENAAALGQTQAAMQSAAALNERAGVPGARIVTEFVAGQAVGQLYVVGDADAVGGGLDDWDAEKITIGEALAATARTVGDQPVEKSDAAAIQAAEARATGLDDVVFPAGVAAEAQAAADANVWAEDDATKLSIGDVLSDAADKMPADKPVERDAAARVADVEARSRPSATTKPGGVAASMVAAARLNRDAASSTAGPRSIDNKYCS